MQNKEKQSFSIGAWAGGKESIDQFTHFPFLYLHTPLLRPLAMK